MQNIPERGEQVALIVLRRDDQVIPLLKEGDEIQIQSLGSRGDTQSTICPALSDGSRYCQVSVFLLIIATYHPRIELQVR